MKLYAQSATTSLNAGTRGISDSYIAVASSLAEIQDDDLISNFTKVWLHLVLVLFPLLTWLMLYLCDPVNLLLGDKTWQKLGDESSHPVIAALIQISALFTFFVFILDWVALVQTVRGDFLAYDRNAAFYLSSATGILIDFGAFGWVVYVLLSSCQWDCKNYWKGRPNHRKRECPERIKKLMYTIMVAPILCLSSHLYYIILAFISDPTHAGFVTYGYVITFFLFYFVFRQVYSRVVLRSNRRQEAWEKEKIAVNVATSQIDFSYRLAQIAKERGDERAYRQTFTENGMEEPKLRKIKPRRRILRVPFDTQVVVRSLVLIGPIMVLYDIIFISLFLSLPVSKSLEAVPASIFSLFGTGFAIVVLLTYSIVLNPSPFSLPKAAEKIGKDLRLPRRYVNWHKFTDEEKFATLVTYLLRHREDLAPSPEPEYSSESTTEGDINPNVRLLEEQVRMEDVIDSRAMTEMGNGRGAGGVASATNLLPLTLNQEVTVETRI